MPPGLWGFGGVARKHVHDSSELRRVLPELTDSLHVEGGRLVCFTWIRPRRPACVVQAEARGTWLVGCAAGAPPAAPSGASEEAPDFTASVSHGREQMGGGIGG